MTYREGVMMDQKFSELAADDTAWLERQRMWVRDHFVEDAQSKYQDVNESSVSL